MRFIGTKNSWLQVVQLCLAIGAITTGCVATGQGPVGGPALRAATPGELHVYALPVGQGDSTLVVAPDGGTLLVDGGGAFDEGEPDSGATVAVPMLRRLNIARLDMVVMTQPHPDHIRGLHAVAAQWRIGTLVHGGTEVDSPDVARLFAAVVDRGTHLQTVNDTPEELVWHGLRLRFLHPRGPGGEPWPDVSLNDNSVVTRIEYGKRSALLAADIETFAENLLSPALGPVDILKVAHHGGDTSSQPAFLAATHPRHAIISCGKNNSFGVPHPAVVARLAQTGATLWRTDTQGWIHFSTQGEAWQVQTEH